MDVLPILWVFPSDSDDESLIAKNDILGTYWNYRHLYVTSGLF